MTKHEAFIPPNGSDQLSELGKLRERVVEVEDDRVIEAEKLSWSTMEISNALVDLNVLAIQGNPSQPRSVRDVMAAFGLVPEWLCEVPVCEPDT
jgi:hypothetical protein